MGGWGLHAPALKRGVVVSAARRAAGRQRRAGASTGGRRWAAGPGWGCRRLPRLSGRGRLCWWLRSSLPLSRWRALLGGYIGVVQGRRWKRGGLAHGASQRGRARRHGKSVPGRRWGKKGSAAAEKARLRRSLEKRDGLVGKGGKTPTARRENRLAGKTRLGRKQSARQEGKLVPGGRGHGAVQYTLPAIGRQASRPGVHHHRMYECIYLCMQSKLEGPGGSSSPHPSAQVRTQAVPSLLLGRSTIGGSGSFVCWCATAVGGRSLSLSRLVHRRRAGRPRRPASWRGSGQRPSWLPGAPPASAGRLAQAQVDLPRCWLLVFWGSCSACKRRRDHDHRGARSGWRCTKQGARGGEAPRGARGRGASGRARRSPNQEARGETPVFMVWVNPYAAEPANTTAAMAECRRTRKPETLMAGAAALALGPLGFAWERAREKKAANGDIWLPTLQREISRPRAILRSPARPCMRGTQVPSNGCLCACQWLNARPYVQKKVASKRRVVVPGGRSSRKNEREAERGRRALSPAGRGRVLPGRPRA